MHSRHQSYHLVVAIAAAALLGGVVGAHSVSEYGHPGQVLDRKSQLPVVALVTAWPAMPSPAKECPLGEGEPLDSQDSAADGKFELKVEASRKLYTVVYCANGYFSRIDRALPNAVDRDPVVPMPAFLRPRTAGQSDSSQIQTTPDQAVPTPDPVQPGPEQRGSLEIGDDVIRTAVYALNELAYLRSINADEFESAINQFSSTLKEEGSGSGSEAFGSLSNVVSAWQK